jgi:tetratricopeptide (TPR) repeat protein
MRSHVADLLPPTVLVVVSMVSSVFLIPSDRELALIHYKAKEFDAAKHRYEALLESGDLTVAVVKSMTELHLQYGEVDEAVALLERFVVRNPEDYEARRVLGTYYHYAERPEAYKENLEAMTSLGLEERTLRELSAIYNARGELDKQVEVLEALTSTFPSPGTAQDLLDLSYIRARLSLHEDAIESLDELARVKEDLVTDDVMELKLNLYLDSDQGRRGLEEARSWLQKRNSPSLVARFADLFAFKSSPEMALELVLPYEDRALDHPVLLAQLVRLQIDTGRAKEAYERLDELHISGRLPEEAIHLLVELELSRNAPTKAVNVLDVYEYDLDALPEWLLGALARSTASLSDVSAARRLTEVMPGRFFLDDPVGAAALWLAAEERVAARHALDMVDIGEGVSPAELADIASLYAELGQQERAYRVLARLAGSGLLPRESFLALASIGVELEREDELLPLLAQHRTRSREADSAWALVALAARQGDRVAQWLQGASEKENEPWPAADLLFDLYYVAERTAQWRIAASLAETLFSRRRDDETLLMLVRAHTLSGQPSRSLGLLRTRVGPPSQDIARKPELENAYLEALRSARAQHLPVDIELRDFIRHKLASTALEDERRKQLLYDLVELSDYAGALPWLRELAVKEPSEWLYVYADACVRMDRGDELVRLIVDELSTGVAASETREMMVQILLQHARTGIVLPHLERLARDEGGDWIFAYEEALEEGSRQDDLIEFWTEVALDTSRPHEDRRARAYRLVEAGRSDVARLTFVSLARDAPPHHADVTELLYLERLDGKSVRPDTADWLVERARASRTADDKAAWMRRLIEAGLPELAVSAAATDTEAPAVRLALIEAAAAAKIPELFRPLVVLELKGERRPVRLRRLGRLALEADALDAADLVFEKLLSIAPDDPRALKQLGLVSFMRSDYSRAEQFLLSYHATGRFDYETSYYYGEVLLRREKTAEAHYYYRRSLELIDAEPSPGFMERATRAQLLHRLERTEDALSAFRSLVEEAPRDLHVRADYIAALLDRDRFAEAETALAEVSRDRRGGGGGLRLDLLEANLLGRTLRHDEALEALVRLRSAHPESANVLAAFAGAQEATGRWMAALRDYDLAVSMDPTNEEIRIARAYARSPHAPNTGMEVYVRNVPSGESLTMSRLAAEGRWRRALSFGVDYRRADRLARAEGSESSGAVFDERAELFLRVDDMAGRWVRGAALVGGGAPGASLELGRRSALSSTRVHAGYGLPYWDLSFAVREQARRDRITLSHESQWSRRLTSSILGSAQRYRFQEQSSFRSVGLTGDATFRVRLSNPTLSLQYLLDSEYMGELPVRLPLRSREVHALGVITSAGLTKHLRADALAGYSWDRLGGSAPFYGAYFGYERPSGLSTRFGIERRLYTLDTKAAETYWLARVFWRF